MSISINKDKHQSQSHASFDDINFVGKENQSKVINQEIDFNDSQLNSLNNKTIKQQTLHSNVPMATDSFTPISLPSNFIFYDFKEIKIRKLTIRDAAKLTSASDSKNYKSFKDAIQCCIDKDINQLTYGDFKYICYWLRSNSYPKTPITIEWTSKYGNKNVSTVLKDQVTTLVNDMTEDSFKSWRNKGFDIPRMKFADIYDVDLTDEQKFIYDNAAYFIGDNWDEKTSNMEKYFDENGLENLYLIKDFDKESEHGVEEEVTVYDTKFDQNDYKKYLEDKLKKLRYAMDQILDRDSNEFTIIDLLHDKIEDDYNALLKSIKNGEVIQAEPEKIFLEMGPDELLSPLFRKTNQ